MKPEQAAARRRARGSSAVELAIAVPLLIGLFLGVFDFGYAFFIYNELEAQVRAGARYASVCAYDAHNPSAYVTAVKNVVLYGSPTGGAEALVPGLTAANVTVTTNPANVTHTPPTEVTVSISNYQVGTFRTMTLTDKPRTQFPYLGDYTPQP